MFSKISTKKLLEKLEVMSHFLLQDCHYNAHVTTPLYISSLTILLYFFDASNQNGSTSKMVIFLQ